jgi:hypothetical protein
MRGQQTSDHGEYACLGGPPDGRLQLVRKQLPLKYLPSHVLLYVYLTAFLGMFGMGVQQIQHVTHCSICSRNIYRT